MKKGVVLIAALLVAGLGYGQGFRVKYGQYSEVVLQALEDYKAAVSNLEGELSNVKIENVFQKDVEKDEYVKGLGKLIESFEGRKGKKNLDDLLKKAARYIGARESYIIYMTEHNADLESFFITLEKALEGEAVSFPALDFKAQTEEEFVKSVTDVKSLKELKVKKNHLFGPESIVRRRANAIDNFIYIYRDLVERKEARATRLGKDRGMYAPGSGVVAAAEEEAKAAKALLVDMEDALEALENIIAKLNESQQKYIGFNKESRVDRREAINLYNFFMNKRAQLIKINDRALKGAKRKKARAND